MHELTCVCMHFEGLHRSCSRSLCSSSPPPPRRVEEGPEDDQAQGPRWHSEVPGTVVATEVSFLYHLQLIPALFQLLRVKGGWAARWVGYQRSAFFQRRLPGQQLSVMTFPPKKSPPAPNPLCLVMLHTFPVFSTFSQLPTSMYCFPFWWEPCAHSCGSWNWNSPLHSATCPCICSLIHYSLCVHLPFAHGPEMAPALRFQHYVII